MATAGDQINRALRLLGVLAEGEQPSVDTSADALVALNQMLDSWSTERLSVYRLYTQTYTWSAGVDTRTIGPTGDYPDLRPVVLDPSTYYTVDGIDYPLEIINQAQYNSIVLKTLSSLPDTIFMDPAYPNATLYLYPVPSVDVEIHIVSMLPLDQVTDLTVELAFPPGYMRAFAYNLAVELAPEFGISAPNDVKAVAVASKRNIKRINNPNNLMSFPSAILPSVAGYNIYAGPYQ